MAVRSSNSVYLLAIHTPESTALARYFTLIFFKISPDKIKIISILLLKFNFFLLE